MSYRVIVIHHSGQLIPLIYTKFSEVLNSNGICTDFLRFMGLTFGISSAIFNCHLFFLFFIFTNSEPKKGWIAC